MIILQLYARMFLAVSIALWGMITFTRLFYLDWVPRTDPCQQVEQKVVLPNGAIYAESIQLTTTPRDITRHEDGKLPSPIPSGGLTRTTSIGEYYAPAAHQSPKKVTPPAVSFQDELSPRSGRLTNRKSVVSDDANASPRWNRQSPKKVHELYRVDDDGHFVIVHRHDKRHVPFKDGTQRGGAAQPPFVDDDGDFVFGHEELPGQADNPPALTHRRLEVADVDKKDTDIGVEHSHLRHVKHATNYGRRKLTTEPEQDNDSTAMIGPTVLVAVASFVIVLAAILYLCDLRDRCRYNQHWKKQRPKQQLPQQQQQHRRGSNVNPCFPLDTIATPGQKRDKKNPLSLSSDRNPSRRSIDRGEIDHEHGLVVGWIGSVRPFRSEEHVPAQSLRITTPVDTDEDYDVQHIPAPGKDPVETQSRDVSTPRASLLESLSAMADRYADEDEEDSERALAPVGDNVDVEVKPEEKRTIRNPGRVKPKVMLSPAVVRALSPTRSEISILTEGSSGDEDADNYSDEQEYGQIEVTTSRQPLVRGERDVNEDVYVTMSTAPSKKRFPIPAYMEGNPDRLLEEERDVTHHHPTVPNNDDGGDDELRIVELSDQADERSQVEQLLTTFIYHSEGGDGPHSTLRGEEEEEEDRTISATSSDDDEYFIRDIFYVPTTLAEGSTNDLILHVIGADCPLTHPMISFVGEDSPLAGRVFPGDYVLSINEEEAGGMSSEDALAHLLAGSSPIIATWKKEEQAHVETMLGNNNEVVGSIKMIKLTVMSSHADGSVTTDASVDLDRPATAAEV